MPGGRPTTYKPEYCSLLIDHMVQGYSFESFAATIECHRDTLYEWTKVHQEFSDAKKMGVDGGLLFWEKLARSGAMGVKSITTSDGRKIDIKAINPTLVIFMMKCRFRNIYNDESIKDDRKEEYATPESLTTDDDAKA